MWFQSGHDHNGRTEVGQEHCMPELIIFHVIVASATMKYTPQNLLIGWAKWRWQLASRDRYSHEDHLDDVIRRVFRYLHARFRYKEMGACRRQIKSGNRLFWHFCTLSYQKLILAAIRKAIDSSGRRHRRNMMKSMPPEWENFINVKSLIIWPHESDGHAIITKHDGE